MKKWDIIIIASLLVISFIPYGIFSLVVAKDYNTTYAVVTVGGKPYEKIPLTGHKGKSEYLIQTPQGNNVVLVEDDKVAVIEADCPDKVCTEPGFISKPGQSLICLPHKVYIGIEGTTVEDDSIDAKAY